ncbi:MAG: hypothetical protein IAF00_01935 [Phycisphaerales bacterium]|nr:hypothetical protein [Phycisphaerales bacterium]
MKKLWLIALLAFTPWIHAHAAQVLYYDSGGFETLGTTFSSGLYPDVSSPSPAFSTLHPSSPQLTDSLFDGASVETLRLSGTRYTPFDPTVEPDAHGNYAVGMVGSPVGTSVYRPNGTLLTYNYDTLSLPIDVSTCTNMVSVTVTFDLSLSALASGISPYNALRPYYSGPVAPVAIVKVFDPNNIDINFNTELSNQTVTGTRDAATPTFTLEWSSQSVTLPLTSAILNGGTQALITISGAGSAAAQENTYISLDNLMIYRNTPDNAGCIIAAPGPGTGAAAIPTTNSYALWVMTLLLLAMGGGFFLNEKRSIQIKTKR